MKSFRICFVVLLVSHLNLVECSTCERRYRNTTVDNKPSKSFKNLSGTPLEAAIIDEISQQLKTNPRIQLRNLGISTITKSMLKKFSDIFSVDLRSNEIAEIEDESFSENAKLEKIDLMENRLTKITKKLLAGDFEDLQEINFSYNTIASVESGAFDKLPRLEAIDLSFNCLRHLHSDLFKKSPELVQVYVQQNSIAKIESDVFNSKTDLKLLDLSRNQLDYVPELEMKKIKHMDLSFNNISLLDLNYASHEKKKSASIVELILAHNRISLCIEHEERRTDILHLDLTHNAMESLDEFPSFLNLEVLILADNNISDLGLHVFEERFPSLKVLNIRENPIECADYRYVRNSYQTLVVAADATIVHRCHHSSNSSSSGDEYDDYVDPVIAEVRSKNREIVHRLRTNFSMLVVLLSAVIVSVIAATIFLMLHRVKPMRRSKSNLIDNMEL